MRSVARSVFVLVGLLGPGAVADVSVPPRAVPLEPVPAILDAFQTHQIVAIGDTHGNEQGHAFLLSLIRDSRFAAVVNDIVVEFGSARYQDVADRYVRGDELPDDLLRQVWQNAVTPTAFVDRPHREILAAVRTVNRSLPRDRQLRVLLGDPPIDWARIRDRKDHWKWVEMRDSYPAALIRLEVLARQRKALIVYGGGHLQRKQMLSNFEMDAWQAQTIVSLLEASGPERVFVIWPNSQLADIQPDVTSWKAPSLAAIKATVLGAADVGRYWGDNPMAATRFAFREGNLVPVPREQWRSLPAEDQFDAVLYLGPPSAMTSIQWSPAICEDAEFIETRLRRIALAGLPQAEADRLKQYCATVKD
jgi:hypothetical protein